MKQILIIILLVISLPSFSQERGTIQWFDQKFENLLKADGHSAEELDIEIGKLIKTHPTNFLKSLSKVEAKILRIDALVGNLGEEFVDQEAKTKIELRERSKSLQNAIGRMNDQRLVKLGKRCIDQLKRP